MHIPALILPRRLTSLLHLRCGWKVGGWRGLAGEGAQRPIQALQTAEEDRILGSEKAKWVALGVPADDT